MIQLVKVVSLLVVGLLFWTVVALLVFVAVTEAGDETCQPEPETPWHPAGTKGCTLDGPTEGVASTWGGPIAAAQWCTYPWQECTTVSVQSHVTGVTIIVTPAQFCMCHWKTDRRLIDLTHDQVRALGLDPPAGLFAVTVTPVRGEPPVPTTVLPDTALEVSR